MNPHFSASVFMHGPYCKDISTQLWLNSSDLSILMLGNIHIALSGLSIGTLAAVSLVSAQSIVENSERAAYLNR